MKRIVLFAALLSFGAASMAQTPSALTTANELFDKAAYAEAIAAYEKAPNIEKGAFVLNRLGLSYHMLERFREAESAYRRAIRADESLAAPYNNLGALYYAQRRFGDADGQFRRAAERDPSSPVVRRNLHASRYARENGRAAGESAIARSKEKPMLIEELLADYLRVLPLMPSNVLEESRKLQTRGDSFLARKYYDDAIIEYRKAIKLDRYDASVFNRLGIAHHQNLQLKEAEQQYREALRLNPAYVEALNNLGTIQYMKRNYEGALDQYYRALRIQPRSATVLGNIGACLFSMERYLEGATAYRQALEIDPSLLQRLSGGGAAQLIQMTQSSGAMMNFHLARIFAERGDKEQAMSFLYKAVERGFADLKALKEDRAFALLADDERFTRLLENMSSFKS